MSTIVLRPLFHRGQECIAVDLTPNRPVEAAVRRMQGVKWSQTHKVWYLALTRDTHQQLVAALKPLAAVDDRLIKQYLQKRRQVMDTQPTPAIDGALKMKPAPATTAWTLPPGHLAALQRFLDHLRLKAYSPSTIKTYRNEFLQLLQRVKKKQVDELTPDDLRAYFLFCVDKLKLTENTLHSRINAVKFYFEQVLGREKFFWEIPRPKKAEKLPNVLGEKEMTRLFRALDNPKHKAILFAAYSAGLRVSEVVALRLKDIDSERMQIKVVAGKGKKDRYVTLSPVLLQALRAYIKSSEQRPTVFLFESETAGVPYSARAAQKVFQRAKAKAGIRKDVSFHSLRHSFATHLLEKGIDIRFIKDILGHESIQTTEKYTHVARGQIVQIKSPLDDFWPKGDTV